MAKLDRLLVCLAGTGGISIASRLQDHFGPSMYPTFPPDADRSIATLPIPLDRQSSIFRSYVMDQSFPCVGARAAINRGRMEFGAYETLGDSAAARQLCGDLAAFSAKYRFPGADPVSFVAMFNHPVTSEAGFTRQLWTHLQRMHDIDAPEHDWDASVSNDPDNESFSFSIAGRAYFVVGLHPQASRMARRAPFPCLVFNFHDQFETLKSSGKYAGMQRVIRARDVSLQGFINPALSTFGDASEARQYAGDDTATNWVCPFKPALLANAG